MNTKTYSSAPLPFMGQKRRFLKHFKQALNTFENTKIVVDLFGGSGLLSHTVKQVNKDVIVVYNDYDDYHLRLINVERTNKHLAKLRVLVKGFPEDKKIPEEIKEKIVSYLKAEEKTGFVDCITLSSSLLFSMNYVTNVADFAKQTLYNCIRKSDYNTAGYLEGLMVVKYDYKELFNNYKDVPGVVFLVDPPYLSTEQSTYKNYWRLADYLDVLNVLKENNYVYFTSDKSSIIELCEWLEKNLDAVNPFKGSKKEELRMHVNHNAGYTDMMLWKSTPSIPGNYKYEIK